MKNYIKLLPLLVLVLSLNGFSQSATITNRLSNQLQQVNDDAVVKVNLIFKNQVDYYGLNQSFKENNTPLSERAKIVIREAMQLANSEQESLVMLFNQKSEKVVSFKQFWLINMMTVEAQKELILELINHPSIDYIEEFDHHYVKPVEILKGELSQEKSIGGIEPGLAAINAPALWAMGYTGRARKYYSIDTGIWKDHPAVADAWLGNYQPLSQAWLPIDSPIPVDKSGSHGTHTAGTVLGLEKATNDTIGVAFNAYFMVADPIVTNLANIKPLPDYINVFEFALNPDGDTTTTDDIPDAINNSWGIATHDDTTICAGYVTQMFDAIEAAGIANVFSAGNEGPGATTIGQPQYVSTGLVNTFTVGAVNGANPSFPITSFSSKGPSPCPNLTGSLLIKPEVVAPGLNVRSSVDQNNYASYSGTSMSGPHVTGAVLLLKEAFPTVSGEDILMALYTTAIDLGVVGEDNTYGRGMIDVLAAYNQLAGVYTPTPPNAQSYDLSIKKISQPNAMQLCDQNITPSVLIENKGDSTIQTIFFTYQLNNEPAQTYTANVTLNNGDTTTINLPGILALNRGNYELSVKAVLGSTYLENDSINNQRFSRFIIRENIPSLPFYENFENTKLDSSYWLIDNPDFNKTWDTSATQGLGASNYSAYINLYSYSPRQSQVDGLFTPIIKLPNRDSLFIKFDVAYQLRIGILADTLRVLISTDCGDTFDEIYKKFDVNLQTNDTVTNNFVPQYASHWREEFIDITAYAGNDVLIRFESINRQGNNLFLDNIWVYQGVTPVGINEKVTLQPISIYPNPTLNHITVDLGSNSLAKANLEVIDLLGKTLMKNVITTSKTQVDLTQLSNGIYFVKFSNEVGGKVYKIVKK
ncbi:MAG: S8 family peptidase [Vicingaceae bacterium]|nr:S8 family peptidase [Vicingaceae bacterium]